MRVAAILFHASAVVIFLQLFLGAMLVFNFLDARTHIFGGLIVLGLAAATMVVTVRSKPRGRPTTIISVALVVLIVFQGLLGFAAFGSDVIVVVHFVNAMIIYALAVLGMFYARAWNKLNTGLPPHGTA